MVGSIPSDPGPSRQDYRLSDGWTEHIGPQGQMYYYNAAQGQSTYDRPAKVHRANIEPVNGHGDATAKEKPMTKEAIPGADGWFRVVTNFDNVFYTHKATKRSEWIAPDEIRTQVEGLEGEKKRLEREKEMEEREEQRRQVQQRRADREKADAERRERLEGERRKKEEYLRRKQEEQMRIQQERLVVLQEASKRKREAERSESQKGEDCVNAEKRAKVDEGVNGTEEEGEEDWQRAMAAEMAAEADELDGVAPEHAAVMEPASLSAEECKDVFKHMLTSLNATPDEINPMMPWDRELPKFINHRDYTVLSSLRDREDVFNEWCKDRIRERRAEKAAGGKGSGTTMTPQSKHVVSKAESKDDRDAEAIFRRLLEQEVRSTRTRWEDFRKEWRKDRRFFAFGRDDREREKAFRAWLRELGEGKRKAAERAENDFLQLLGERLKQDDFTIEKEQSKDAITAVWQSAKRSPGLDRDPRYDAVGSSSRRAELFELWAKRSIPQLDQKKNASQDGSRAPPAEKHRDTESALREREEKVRRQQREAEKEKSRTYVHVVHDESKTKFQQLLVDAVRDPLAALTETFDAISHDDRFRAPGLGERERADMFYQHVQNLNERRLRGLEEVFLRHAPTLDVESEMALPLIQDDDEIRLRNLDKVQSLISGHSTMADLFDEWKEKREAQARKEFDELLRQNAFVSFWGRLRQEYHRKNQGSASTSKADDDGSDIVEGNDRREEDDEDEAVPSLLQMAANVDLDEVHAILGSDARYRAFRHMPRERDVWIREYLQRMDIPKQTVFQKQ